YSSTATFAIDATAPAVSRVVVADATSGTAGFVEQGGSYYTYGQVSDAGTGVSGVAADLHNVTTGATALSMSAGSWTIGGQTYNYRSSQQTANDPLAESGNPYAFSVSASDG